MGDRLKILVVDDDRRMVRTTCDILRVKGHEAVPAYSGDEAVNMAGSIEPDCVLMDLRMPGMDGMETLQLMKQTAPAIPVVLMSANATEEQEQEAKRLGALAVLAKPIDVQAMLSFLAVLEKGETILVVDDDPAYCRTLKDTLESRGFEVQTETDPARVLERMEQIDSLTVLLDLKLGNVNGVDVLRDIRKKYPAKPVVLITRLRDLMSESVERAMRIGAFTTLYKPLELDKLMDIIAQISRRRLQIALSEPHVEEHSKD